MRLWIWRWQYEVYKWLHFTVYFIENKMVDISYTEYYDHDRTEILKRERFRRYDKIILMNLLWKFIKKR